MKFTGFNDEELIKESRLAGGKNVITPPPTTPAWKLFLEKFKDPIIIILLIALGISFVVGFVEGDLTESVGILIAVLLATGVGFWMEHSANKKFEALNQLSDTELVKVHRFGRTVEIPKDEVVVGDVVILAAGDEVPADIELFEVSHFKVDESTMTGESMPVSKIAKEDGQSYQGSGFPPYLVLRSTKVSEGFGTGVVVAVGDKTEIGKTTRQAMEETEGETPLQGQLNRLASLISKVAVVLSAGLVAVMSMQKWILGTEVVDSSVLGVLTDCVKIIMIAVTLIVVAVPEGLPLASTLSLAFSMKTMAKENNLIKKLHACETIGAVNIIFSDKTGTLTQNKMTVEDYWDGQKWSINKVSDKVALALSVNSTADLGPDASIIGNPTEGALLNFLRHHGKSYKDLRSSVEMVDVEPFNSTTKFMKTVFKSEGKEVVVVKGAPEVIIRMVPNLDVEKELEIISKQQARGRRAISLAISDTAGELVYHGTFFIEDPIRNDVPGAVKDCYRAGIDVVMMTGDNIKTAREIAVRAGFNRALQGVSDVEPVWAIEAKDFDELAWGDSSCGYPNVIARCKPEDKLRILNKFKSLNSNGSSSYVCAMTGDGVNDAPSLNHADVGIAMGSGTSVAKEASDIILLDDSFPSIVTGVKWGRSLYKNIQSFLTFQLIINVATCLVVLFGPLLGVDMPFTITQMLWVNIVMDTLAALCLASEPADSNVLQELPRKVSDFIITKPMMKTILGMGIGMAAGLSLIVFDISQGSIWFNLDLTELFAIFMMICWWNLFNIRVFGKNRSAVYGLHKSKNFLLGALAILVGTICIIQYGGEIFNTRPMDLDEWLIIIASTSSVLVVREFYHIAFAKKEGQ